MGIAMIMPLSISLYSCKTTIKTTTLPDRFGGRRIEVLVIDGCEYIYFFSGNSEVLAHKGNCKYCAMREKH